jgi:hypothetical protein
MIREDLNHGTLMFCPLKVSLKVGLMSLIDNG